MIIDGHAHVTESDYGSAELLLQRYSESGIDKGILVPGGMLDVRQMTKYINGKEQPKGDMIPNNLVKNAIEKYPDKFFGFYCVNPHKGNEILEDLSQAVENGFVGLKLAPMVHQFSLSSKMVYELADLCGNLNIPFYTHVVFSPAASTKKMFQLAKEFPKTTFILGHMGFGPSDMDAIAYAKQLANLYLESSQGSYVSLKEALNVLGSKKLIFGSEFPMYHPKASLESIFTLNCTSGQLEDILCNNILQLINRKAVNEGGNNYERKY